MGSTQTTAVGTGAAVGFAFFGVGEDGTTVGVVGAAGEEAVIATGMVVGSLVGGSPVGSAVGSAAAGSGAITAGAVDLGADRVAPSIAAGPRIKKTELQPRANDRDRLCQWL